MRNREWGLTMNALTLASAALFACLTAVAAPAPSVTASSSAPARTNSSKLTRTISLPNTTLICYSGDYGAYRGDKIMPDKIIFSSSYIGNQDLPPFSATGVSSTGIPCIRLTDDP